MWIISHRSGGKGNQSGDSGACGACKADACFKEKLVWVKKNICTAFLKVNGSILEDVCPCAKLISERLSKLFLIYNLWKCWLRKLEIPQCCGTVCQAAWQML